MQVLDRPNRLHNMYTVISDSERTEIVSWLVWLNKDKIIPELSKKSHSSEMMQNRQKGSQLKSFKRFRTNEMKTKDIPRNLYLMQNVMLRAKRIELVFDWLFLECRPCSR